MNWSFPLFMSVIIPDDILQASNMTEDELKLEIAILLYQQGNN
ncbi:hypothetical protein [Nostoc sp. ChiSLP03a]|nr:hypothetical protein [Nostoc sp. ChiSLP03a]MDZ8214618.1 hypothetical protein [Nostoc sp. ChiSLP03a]